MSPVARAIEATDPRQAPGAFSRAGSNGCGLLLLYGWNRQRTEVIVVEADQGTLQLDKGSKTFDLANADHALRVHLDVYEKSQERFDYCSDLKIPLSEKKAEVWLAQSGQITIEVGGRTGFHQATAQLNDVVFRKANGTLVKFSAPISIAATVGGFSG
jgi:hypothetical protein